MKNLKNKIATIVISIFFILSMTTSLTLIPSAMHITPHGMSQIRPSSLLHLIR